MAETVRLNVRPMTAQNSGNPVLDSLVNLLAGQAVDLDVVEAVHATLLKLAEKEPGGLNRSLNLVE